MTPLLCKWIVEDLDQGRDYLNIFKTLSACRCSEDMLPLFRLLLSSRLSGRLRASKEAKVTMGQVVVGSGGLFAGTQGTIRKRGMNLKGTRHSTREGLRLTVCWGMMGRTEVGEWEREPLGGKGRYRLSLGMLADLVLGGRREPCIVLTLLNEVMIASIPVRKWTRCRDSVMDQWWGSWREESWTMTTSETLRSNPVPESPLASGVTVPVERCQEYGYITSLCYFTDLDLLLWLELC